MTFGLLLRRIVNGEAFPSKIEEKKPKVLKDFQKESLLVKSCYFLCKIVLKSEIDTSKNRF